MSLTLFPITAILLLLSGVCIPAHAAVAPENHAALLRELFGNYDAENDDALWTPSYVPKAYTEYFPEGHGYTSVVFDSQFNQGSDTKRLLVFGTVPERGWGCHACRTLVSAATFHKAKGQQWHLEARKDFLVEGGESGYAPYFHLRRLGKHHVALQLQSDHCGPGDCSAYVQLFAVTPPVFHLILGVRRNYEPSELGACLGVTKYQDYDDCGQAHIAGMCYPRVSKRNALNREYCTYWTSTLRALSPVSSDIWSDLAYTQHVKLAVPGAFTHKQYRTRFGFSNGAYQAMGPPSHGPRTDLGWYQE